VAILALSGSQSCPVSTVSACRASEGESSTQMLEEVNDGGVSKTVVKLSDAELLELGGGADQDQS
jgi:peptidyl-tRNA hydrolase